MQTDRDFAGYGAKPPNPSWPNTARVAVSFVVNVEEGAELSVADGDERNEAVYEVTDEVRDAPDPCRDSHFEYGTRVGYWRIMRLLELYAVPATLNACGRSVFRSPWLARDAVTRGHEVACHGWRWERHAGMDEATERRAIARACAAIRDATGTAPVGWHTRSTPSVNTRRLLLEHGGFLTTAMPIATICRFSFRWEMARGSWCCRSASTPTICISTRGLNGSPPRRISPNMSSMRSTSFGPKGRICHGCCRSASPADDRAPRADRRTGAGVAPHARSGRRLAGAPRPDCPPLVGTLSRARCMTEPAAVGQVSCSSRTGATSLPRMTSRCHRSKVSRNLDVPSAALQQAQGALAGSSTLPTGPRRFFIVRGASAP